MGADFHRMAQDAPTMADRFDVYAAEQSDQASFWGEQADYHRGAAEWCEAQVARRKGRAGGYEFRAEELRYDARGGMTRAQAAGQVIDALTEIMEAGAVKPVMWSRDEMTEAQATAASEARQRCDRGEHRAAGESMPGACADCGVDWADLPPDPAAASGETWDEPRKGDG